MDPMEKKSIARGASPQGAPETRRAGLYLALAFIVPLALLVLFVMLSDFLRC